MSCDWTDEEMRAFYESPEGKKLLLQLEKDLVCGTEDLVYGTEDVAHKKKMDLKDHRKKKRKVRTWRKRWR